MAPTLTSNSFLLTTTPRSRLAIKSPKPSGPIFAKLNFRIGKKDGDGDGKNQSVASDDGKKSKKSPFFFDIDFGKMPDMKSMAPVVAQPSTALSFVNSRRKDPRTVFVAWATGLSGARIARALLRQGFVVRAGVPELAAAQDLARLAAKYKIISPEESRRLNAVESTFQDPKSIAKAIGNASKVVVTIGPSENGPTSSEVTTSDALQVILAAQLAGVGHVAVIYEDGFASGASTYNVLDGITSFFSNFLSRSKPLTLTEFLAKVVETDVSYTLIKAFLAEEYSTGYSDNVVVTAEGTADEYGEYNSKVSKSQIASLVAGVFANTSVAENKVVKVSTSPSAPPKSIDELFSAIPEDGRRKAYAEALAKAKAEEEALAASEKARQAAEATKKLEQEVKKLSEQEAWASNLAEEAQEKAKVAGSSLEDLMSKAKDLGSGFSWDKLSSQIVTAVSQKDEDENESENEKPKVQIATVRGQAKAQTLTPKKAFVKPPPPPKPKAKSTQPKPEVKKVFGGLFTQETIYIDDD